MRKFQRAMVVAGAVLFSAALAATQTGCLLVAAAGGAAATVAYVKGDLDAVVDAGPERVVAATKAAMDDLKLPILSSYANGLEGEVQARVGTDNKAVVSVHGQSEKLSKISIRIGTFGDEAMSRQILEKIKAHLNDPVAVTTTR